MKIMMCAGLALAMVAAAAAPAVAAAIDTPITSGPLSGNDASDLLFIQGLLNDGGPPKVTSIQRISDGGDQVWGAVGGNITLQFLGAGFNNGFGYVMGASGGVYAPFAGVLGSGVGSGFGEVEGPGATLNLNGGNPFDFRLAINANMSGHIFTSSNTDNPDGEDHMVTWLITGGTDVGKYLIGFEDLSSFYGQSNDHDYEDGILLVAGAVPKAVPEPATMVLLGAGALGIFAASRRRKTALKA